MVATGDVKLRPWRPMQPEVNRMAPLRNLITSPPPVIDIVVQYDLVIGTGLEHTAVEETQNCARSGTGRNLSILVNGQNFFRNSRRVPAIWPETLALCLNHMWAT
jgi:hypothetical protein